jgi:hypothetical protein
MILNNSSIDIPSLLSPWLFFYKEYIEFFTLVLQLSIYSTDFFFRMIWKFGVLLTYPACVLVIYYSCFLICMCTYNAFIHAYFNMFLPVLLTNIRFVLQSLAHITMCWSAYFRTTTTLMPQYSHLSIADKVLTRTLNTSPLLKLTTTFWHSEQEKIEQYVWKDRNCEKWGCLGTVQGWMFQCSWSTYLHLQIPRQPQKKFNSKCITINYDT